MLGLDNPIHIAFLLVLVLLVFGAKRLPEMGRSLGAGMRGFRDEISSHTDAVKGELSPSSPPVTVAAEAPARPAEPAQRV
jgi:sec-independent protein translocase protein TatA